MLDIWTESYFPLDPLFVAPVEMPKESGILSIVQGCEMPTKKLARFATSIKVCKMLHSLGELDNNLLPSKRLKVFKFYFDK